MTNYTSSLNHEREVIHLQLIPKIMEINAMSSGDCKHCPYFHTAKPDDYIRNKWIIKDKINLIFTNNTDKFKYDNEKEND